MIKSYMVSGAIALLGTGALGAQGADRVAAGVYRFAAGGGNAGWVELDECVLLIDASRVPNRDTLLRAVRRATPKPVCYAFETRAVSSGAHTGQVVEFVPASRTSIDGVRFPSTLQLGGARGVRLIALDPGAAPGNAVAFAEDGGVLFVGDLVGVGADVRHSRSDAWLEAIESLQRLEVRQVIPGRGAPGDSTHLAKFRADLAALRAHVRAGIEAGRSEANILAAVPRASTLPDGMPEHVYREMTGLHPAATFIAERELREGPSPTARDPGWTRPKKIVVAQFWNDGRIAQLERLAPGLEVAAVRTAAEALAVVPGADALLGLFSAELLRAGPDLRWVQSASAGVEGYLTVPELRDRNIVLTNAQRLQSTTLAEHVVGLILALSRRMPVAYEAQRERRWGRSAIAEAAPFELDGKTLLVVGLGGIGTEVAQRGHALGMRVLATRASRRTGPEYVRYVGLSHELLTLTPEADVVVNTVPFTAETEDMFDAVFFDAMKPTAYFINIGRGGSVDQAALISALKAGKLAGAGLDVTDPEPLPSDSELWSLPNVIITPHVGASSDVGRERLWLLFRENVRRFVNGEPLLSVVDKERGY